jgi:hypothetical protein
MSEVTMLHGAQVEETLQIAIDRKIPAIMSYLSANKWHVAKVLLTDLTINRLTVERSILGKKSHPINIQVNQPVGISFKYEYGKSVFDTTVVALEPSPTTSTYENAGQIYPEQPDVSKPVLSGVERVETNQRGGRIILAIPDKIEVIERRSYFRVNVPEPLNVKVTLWHLKNFKLTTMPSEQNCTYYQGKLVDISAGGAQIMIPNPAFAETSALQRLPVDGLHAGRSNSFLKRGQFIGVRFTPMPYETPLIFNGKIRHILPSEDHKNIYLGLQIIGLEASFEGQQVLSRIAEVVERYHQLNLSGPKQLEMRSAVLHHKLTTITQKVPLLCL